MSNLKKVLVGSILFALTIVWSVAATRITRTRAKTPTVALSNQARSLEPIQLTRLISRQELYGFLDIALVGGSDAWGVGRNGRDSNKIYHSTDGGRSWQSVDLKLKAIPFNVITFLDAKYGWAAGDSGLLVRTRDGGLTWEEQDAPAGDDFTGIHFMNHDIGFISTKEWSNDPYTGDGIYRARILRTGDGGKTWRVCYQKDGAHNVFAMAFHSKAVVASIDSDFLIRSEDGGSSWAIVASGKGEFADVVFTPGGVGIAIGSTSGDRGVIHRSMDQGKSWQRIEALPSDISNRNWWSVGFIDKDRGVMSGEHGGLAVTTNGGTNWSFVKTDLDERLAPIRLNAQSGIVIGFETVYALTFPD